MGYGVKDLGPGSLYITVAIPLLNPYEPLAGDLYHPHLLDGLDPKTYETAVASGNGREEFDWGLYWLDYEGSHGTWYTLRREPPARYDNGDILTSCPASYTLSAASVRPSALRLNSTILGLIRVLSLPHGVGAELPGYLDWLTAHAAPTATRTFIWATTVYMRCKKHVAHAHTETHDGNVLQGFDINLFLHEALEFAYDEAWHALMGGQLPRPVMVSEFGVELRAIDEGEEDFADVKGGILAGHGEEWKAREVEEWKMLRGSKATVEGRQPFLPWTRLGMQLQ